MYTEEEKKITFEDIDIIYKAASLIGKSILQCEKWNFDGTFNKNMKVPGELSRFLRWVITGPATFNDVLKEEDVNRRVRRLADSTINMKHSLGGKLPERTHTSSLTVIHF